MPHIPVEYFIGTGLAMLASIVGTLGVIYKKKDDDDQISKGEIVYIVLRGILAGIVGVNLGMLVFQTHTYSYFLAILAGLMRGKFLEDLANLGNDVFASVFNSFKMVLTKGLAEVPKPEPKPVQKGVGEETKEVAELPKPDAGQKATWYSQLNPKWKAKLLPGATDPEATWGMYGCYATCIGMIYGLSPDELETKVGAKGWDAEGYAKTDIIVKELNGKYLGSRPSPDTKNACIAKTFVNIGGKTLSHFYINLPSGLIVDPATTFPKEEVNTKYKPVEFRWFEGGVI